MVPSLRFVVTCCLVTWALGTPQCPLSNRSTFCTTPDHLCSPRRCCGNPLSGPVLGGIDLVDLYNCNQLKTSGGQVSCLPAVGKLSIVSKPAAFGGEYYFLFLNETNQQAFDSDPVRYAPKAGGFCAFSLTGFDSNGAGFWCSCPRQEEGYAFVNSTFYFFLFSGARDAFLKHGNDAVVGVERNWPILLEENGKQDLHCFNTDRLVPAEAAENDGDKCDMRSCLKFMKCPDCTQ